MQAHLDGRAFAIACYNEPYSAPGLFGTVKISEKGARISLAGAGEYQT
jgi:hypothetical protein